MNDAATRGFQGQPKPTACTRASHCRAAKEKQWVEALLQLCGATMRPVHLGRWLGKYADDCRRLRRCNGQCCH